jgi:hypothetical protein
MEMDSLTSVSRNLWIILGSTLDNGLGPMAMGTPCTHVAPIWFRAPTPSLILKGLGGSPNSPNCQKVL